MKTVEQIMMPQMVSCKLSESIEDAEAKMLTGKFEIMTVVDEDQHVVGTIRLEDIRNISAKKSTVGFSVNHIMNSTSYAINAHEDEAAAYSTMKSCHMNRLPVVDDENHLKGSVSFVSIARRIVNFRRSLSRFGKVNRNLQKSRPDTQ